MSVDGTLSQAHERVASGRSSNRFFKTRVAICHVRLVTMGHLLLGGAGQILTPRNRGPALALEQLDELLRISPQLYRAFSGPHGLREKLFGEAC